MKKWKQRFARKRQEQSRIAFLGGTYSVIVTVLVLGILIAVNVLASALPTSLTKYDVSSSQLYSVTSNTKVVVNALSDDVTIYWIVQAGEEDDVIENLLDRYESLSDHVDVVKKDPDAYPTFAEQYTDEEVANNSLVVECGDKSRYIAYDSIYEQTTDVYSYSYNTSFDGEGCITSAINYVTSDTQPKLYYLEGHGESDLPSSFTEQLEKDNIETESLSLVKTGSVPEDADCVMVYAPTSDISEEEKEILANYISGGGKLFAVVGPTEDESLDCLNSILSQYNVTTDNGIVVESDSDHYAFGYPYILIPDMDSGDITDSLIDAGYTAILPIASGLTVGEESENGTVTQILATSDTSFSKADGYALESYDKEDGDTDGPFAVGVSISDVGGGQIVWFSSSAFLDDMYNAYSSGANVDLAMNAVSGLIGETETMSIRSKSMNYSYLTISDSTSSLLKALMVGVFPIVYIGVGIAIVVGRRKVQYG